jgi:hypothetical protein
MKVREWEHIFFSSHFIFVQMANLEGQKMFSLLKGMY